MTLVIALAALALSVANTLVNRAHRKRYDTLRRGSVALLSRVTVVENRVLAASAPAQRPFKAPPSWHRLPPEPVGSPAAVKAENECPD